MKKNPYFLNTLLAVVVFAVALVMMVLRVLSPVHILPAWNIPFMVLLSLAALLLEHYLAPGNPRCYICIPVFAVLTFGLLPLMAGFACQHDFWKYGLVGGVVFTVTTFLFTSMTDRLLTGPKAKAALVVCSLGIWLAAQCFAGIIL